MNTKLALNIGTSLLFLSTLNPQLSTAFAQGTAFTYHGLLSDNGMPAHGVYDLQFRLFNLARGGSQQGSTVIVNEHNVSNGLFTVTLDFGSAVFDGSDLWLEIALRPTGSGEFTQLVPRQPITPAPYAIHATTAGTAALADHAVTAGYAANAGYANSAGFASNALNATLAQTAALASNVAPNGVSSAALQNGSVIAAKIGPGVVVRSLNTLTDHVLLEAGPNIVITSRNQTISVSASAAVGASGWGFAGNTVSSGDFLGTLNNEALEIRVNNASVLRLEPRGESPNLRGGHAANVIANDAAGVVIAGGGQASEPQQALGSYAVIGGGWSNAAGGLAVVGGGFGNCATGSNSVVAGGAVNVASGIGAVVAGRRSNLAVELAAVGGGTGNNASGLRSVIAGGHFNQAEGQGSIISGVMPQ
jgi:hypothetical protein